MAIVLKTKILRHAHSGRLAPHAHTSYASLAFLLMVSGIVLMLVSQTGLAVSPPPQVGTVGLKGVVPGQAPQSAATILVPTNGTHYTDIPITVSGTCPKDTIVEIFENNIFAGSNYCRDDSTFTIQIALLDGPNTLVAKVFDALDQAGPDSNSVSVVYDPKVSVPLFTISAPNAVPTNYTQLLLKVNPVYRGSFATQSVDVVVEVIGGLPPFALIVDWGDGKTDLLSRPDNNNFTASHVFSRPGVYQVIIKGTDAHSATAYLQTTVIVNGQSDLAAGTAASSGTKSNSTVANIWLAWPMWILLLLVVLSFWLGERHEKSVLRRRGQLVTKHAWGPSTPPETQVPKTA